MTGLDNVFLAAYEEEQQKRAVRLVRETGLSGHVQTSYFIDDLTTMLMAGLEDSKAELYIRHSMKYDVFPNDIVKFISPRPTIHPAFH